MTTKEALRILLEYASLGESEFGGDEKYHEAYDLIKKNLDADDEVDKLIDALGLRLPGERR